VENLFKKQSATFNLNRISFTEVMVKTFLVFFYAPQCIYAVTEQYTRPQLFISQQCLQG